MKAIFVESLNGYMAHGPKDDMQWTPRMDKQIFRLLAATSGDVYVCSRNTYELLPASMTLDAQRRFYVASRNGGNSLINLGANFPNAVLMGGPTFLRTAYDMNLIDTFVVTTLNMPIAGDVRYCNPFKDVLSNMPPVCAVRFPEMTVRVYRVR